MKIEVDEKTIDKLLGKRVTEFNKKIRDLESKLKRRDNRIHKLEKELERTKASLVINKGEDVVRIAKIAEALVTEMEAARWITRTYDCEDDHYCDCHDFY